MDFNRKVQQKLRPVFEQLLQSLANDREGGSIKKQTIESVTHASWSAIAKFQMQRMIGLDARQQEIEEVNDLELFGGVRNYNMAVMEMDNELNNLSPIREENELRAIQQRQQRIVFGQATQSILYYARDSRQLEEEAPRTLLGMAKIRAGKQRMILERNTSNPRRNN